MIRKYKKEDLERIVDIWLEASIIAHNFIPKTYWEDNVSNMRDIYIPASDTYVFLSEEPSEVKGFISLIDNHIAAIFVSPADQGQGIGKELIAHAKTLHRSLTLAVYSDNLNSVAFYQKQGFRIKEEQVDENTGCDELIMMCGK